MAKRITLVIGSANMDVVAHVPRIPAAGETLIGTAVEWLPGGKGLNQACAASAVYSPVTFIGAVGVDDSGASLIARLEQYGIDASSIIQVAEEPSGTAHITVDDAGSNSIVVIPGANGFLSAQHVELFFKESGAALRNCVTVLQGEIPFDTCLRAAELTVAVEGRVVFNLAPAAAGLDQLLAYASPLVVNEHEAGLLLDQPAPTTWEAAESAATELLSLSPSVIVTLGVRGSVVAEGQEGSGALVRIDATPTKAVDSTGAGDAFVGVLAAALCAGMGLVEAARTASRAAALTVRLPGASQSYTALENFALR